MKSRSPAIAFWLICLLGCFALRECRATDPLVFNWPLPARFQVVELVGQKGNVMRIWYDCQLFKTNQEYVLQWLDAKFLEFNGAAVDESTNLKHTLEPLQASFRYPSFRIGPDGTFLGVINDEEYVEKVNQMLDKTFPGRPADSHKFYDEFSQSEMGKQMVKKVFGVIWQTWVEAWTGLDLPAGRTVTNEQTIEWEGAAVPLETKTTNGGYLKSDTNLLSLRYEQNLTATNFGGILNKFISDMTNQIDIQSAGPIPDGGIVRRDTILKVRTERQSLRPHWAQRIIITTMSVPSETQSTNVEVHEYTFQWSNTNNFKANQQP